MGLITAEINEASLRVTCHNKGFVNSCRFDRSQVRFSTIVQGINNRNVDAMTTEKRPDPNAVCRETRIYYTGSSLPQ